MNFSYSVMYWVNCGLDWAMASLIDEGTWVEIRRLVLRPDERAPQAPQETRKVPLEMRVKGFLARPAFLGDDAEIITATGRHLSGTLEAVQPSYDHGFGAPIRELLEIGGEVRALLHDPGDSR